MNEAGLSVLPCEAEAVCLAYTMPAMIDSEGVVIVASEVTAIEVVTRKYTAFGRSMTSSSLLSINSGWGCHA